MDTQQKIEWLKDHCRCDITEKDGILRVWVFQDQKGTKPGGWSYSEDRLDEAIQKVHEIKDMDPDRRVTISIDKYARRADGSTDHFDKEVMYMYDLPRWMWQKYDWLIEWRRSIVQCKYPRNRVSTSCAFYDRAKSGKSIAGTNKAKLIRSRGMVTQIQNKLEEFKRSYVPTLYEPEAEQTDQYKSGLRKLEEYKNQVIELETLLS